MFVYKQYEVINDIMECISDYEVEQGFDIIPYKAECWEKLEDNIRQIIQEAYPISDYERKQEEEFYKTHCEYYYHWTKKCRKDTPWCDCSCDGVLRLCEK